MWDILKDSVTYAKIPYTKLMRDRFTKMVKNIGIGKTTVLFSLLMAYLNGDIIAVPRSGQSVQVTLPVGEDPDFLRVTLKTRDGVIINPTKFELDQIIPD